MQLTRIGRVACATSGLIAALTGACTTLETPISSPDGAPLSEECVSSVGIRMVLIKPGQFVMGSPATEPERKANETPHNVVLTYAFYMGAYEVTQQEWTQVMRDNPSYFKGERLPVEMVSWHECQEFCRRLTALDRKNRRIPDGWEYQLPTESEQEYACRAGTTTAFHYGDSMDSTDGNINGASPYAGASSNLNRQATLPVGSFEPNAWGLYDMHGNVYEWCHDYWGGYPSGTVTNPVRTNPHPRRVYRGGAWRFGAATARSAKRSQRDPAKMFDFMGFRVVLSETRFPEAIGGERDE